ncbi:MAG: ATP-binding protein, partial [Chitinophagales bacterium]
LLLVVSSVVSAQDPKIDSLKLSLAQTKEDTTKVMLMDSIAWFYGFYDIDSSIAYARKAIERSQSIHYPYGEFWAYLRMSLAYTVFSDYAKALELQINSLRIAQQLPDRRNETIAQAHMFIGYGYRIMDNYHESIAQHNLATQFQKASGKPLSQLINSYNNAAITYSLMGEKELALHFADSAYDLMKKSKTILSWPLENQGRVQLLCGNYPLAAKFLRAAMAKYPVEQSHDNGYFHAGIYITMARILFATGQYDSSIYYADLALQICQKNKFLHYDRDASNLLAKNYKLLHQADSVVKYLERSVAANDSILSPIRVSKFQSIGFLEEERQREIEATKERFKAQERFYALLAALAVFFLVAFMLYRNNRQKQKTNAMLNRQKEELQSTLNELRTTQAQLIQSEKMASLGEMTAGIAHEIQNPLNFVNNFSEVNAELLEEMNKAWEEGNTNEARSLSEGIKQNLEKINHHGKRADAIVKGMLMHSRTSKGQKELVDINAMVDEYLKLSYHGMRAKDKFFNAKFITSLDESLGKINLVPQDMGRVFVNLFNNAFYSINEKRRGLDGKYEPELSVSTKNTGSKVEIRIKDNGPGILKKNIDKIYQPFFTTKPTGEGTGLGLSLSYDIITKEHGGEIKVETVEGEYTEFTIYLPVF